MINLHFQKWKFYLFILILVFSFFFSSWLRFETSNGIYGKLNVNVDDSN